MGRHRGPDATRRHSPYRVAYGIHLGVVEVVVPVAGVGVDHAVVGLERPVRDADVLWVVQVGPEWVDIDHEGRARLPQEGDQGAHHRLRDVVLERALRRRPRRLERGERHRRGHLDGAVEAQASQRRLHVPHGRDQLLGQVLGHVEHLVPHGDAVDERGGVERRHVVLHPLARERRAGGRRGQLLVGQRHHELDAGVGQSADHPAVSVVDPHHRDALLLQQLHHRRWGRYVVPLSPPAHAHLAGCTGEEEQWQ